MGSSYLNPLFVVAVHIDFDQTSKPQTTTHRMERSVDATTRDQVTFDRTAKTYPIEEDVECHYVMKPTHKASSYDWVGLFKVGWASHKDYIFFHWVPSPKNRTDDSECQGSVVFPEDKLPRVDGEYYQFVYFNEKGKMSGSSSPFYFINPRNDDIVEEVMSDDADMLYITTKKGQLQEKTLQCEKLAKTVDALNEEILNQAEQLELCQKKRNDMEQQEALLVLKLQGVEAEKKEEVQLLKGAADKDIAVLKEKIVSLEEEIETLQLKQGLLLGQIATVEEKARSEVAVFKQQLAEAKPDQEAFDTLQAQLSSSQDTVARLEQYKKQQKDVITEQHDKLLATEARHAVDLAEISSLTETLTNLSSKVEEVNSDNEALKNKLIKLSSQYDDEKADWISTLEKMEKEKNGLLSTIGELNLKLDQIQAQTVSAESFDIQEDRYIALQAAYGLLKDELREQNKNLASLQRREQRQRTSTSVQLSELKDKLKESEEDNAKLGGQKAKLERRIAKASRSSGLTDSFLLKRSMSSSGKDELTREELQKMVEQLSAELEARTLKKDRYKDKYLEEKQRAATARDHYKSEVEKLRGDLALARGQLDIQVSSPVAKEPVTTPSAIVYPGITHGPTSPLTAAAAAGPFEYPDARPKERTPPAVPSRNRQNSPSKGALEQSLVEEKGDKVMLTPLPPPIEPQRPPQHSQTPQETSSPQHPSLLYPSVQLFPRQKRTNEEIVLHPHQSDSDEDNENTDRFQDALDEPSSQIKCFYCDKVFDIHDSEEMRNAHACQHLSCTVIKSSDVDNYQCPLCQQKFAKRTITLDKFEAHVQAHFTDPQ